MVTLDRSRRRAPRRGASPPAKAAKAASSRRHSKVWLRHTASYRTPTTWGYFGVRWPDTAFAERRASQFACLGAARRLAHQRRHDGATLLASSTSTRTPRRLLAALALWLLATAGLAHAAEPPAGGFLRTEGPYIVDPQGRVVILRGFNTGNIAKDGVNVYGPLQQELPTRNPAWGFNCMRLVFVWEGLEPTPGAYDEAYLKRLEELVAICHAAGVWAVLDMHQDLFSRRYGGDGAPAWACQDKGLPMTQAPYWGLNYLAAPVMACFDAFWADAPGPDGVGIQTHYIKAWRSALAIILQE